MSVELIAISSFVVAILGGIAHCVNKSNLKQCKMCCIDSDCRDENKATDLKMKELNEKIMKNEKKISKNKTKLEDLKMKKRLSNVPVTPVSGASDNSALSELSMCITEI
jgi:hypothetical protein